MLVKITPTNTRQRPIKAARTCCRSHRKGTVGRLSIRRSITSSIWQCATAKTNISSGSPDSTAVYCARSPSSPKAGTTGSSCSPKTTKLAAQKYSDLLQTHVSADDLRFAHDIDLYLVRQSDGTRELKHSRFMLAGGFNWRNQFNQGPGIVHLSHRANSLGAEVNLAVTSALPRADAAGRTVVASPVQKLICCTGGGDPNRSSDPRIAAAAYSSVVDKTNPKFFTLTDPVGLYISEFGYNALQYPNDPAKTSAYEWWSVQRGKDAI